MKSLLRIFSRILNARHTNRLSVEMTAPAAFSVTEKPDVGFVACIESGVLEAQALLLFESIRRYTARFKDCAIYALSPRAGHAISTDTRKDSTICGCTTATRFLIRNVVSTDRPIA